MLGEFGAAGEGCAAAVNSTGEWAVAVVDGGDVLCQVVALGEAVAAYGAGEEADALVDGADVAAKGALLAEDAGAGGAGEARFGRVRGGGGCNDGVPKAGLRGWCRGSGGGRGGRPGRGRGRHLVGW